MNIDEKNNPMVIAIKKYWNSQIFSLELSVFASIIELKYNNSKFKYFIKNFLVQKRETIYLHDLSKYIKSKSPNYKIEDICITYKSLSISKIEEFIKKHLFFIPNISLNLTKDFDNNKSCIQIQSYNIESTNILHCLKVIKINNIYTLYTGVVCIFEKNEINKHRVYETFDFT